MAAAHGLSWSWLKNGLELHTACCEVNRRHVPAYSPALLVLTFSALQTAGQSCGNAARAHCPKSYILCFGQVDLSIVISSILLVLLARAMSRCHRPSATRPMGMTRILGDVTHTLNSLVLVTRHAVLPNYSLIFFFVQVYIFKDKISNMAAQKIGTTL